MNLETILASGEPYFGGFLIAEQGPYDRYLPHFINLVSKIKTPIPTILEVGSWAGASVNTWDTASLHLAQFTVVDQWAPYFNDRSSETYCIMDEAARSGQIEALFRHNMKVLGIDRRLEIIKGDSRGILPAMSPESNFDIVFVDGNHQYEFIRADIIHAMPLVKEGGILCGDDLQLQLTQIQEWIPQHHQALEQGKAHICLPGDISYHPGVTQAVAEIFGQVNSADRLWAMQKVNGAWAQVSF